MSESKKEQVLELARSLGVVRPIDIEARGIHREYLRRLESEGMLMRSGRGLYILSDRPVTENHSLASACKRVPHGIVCLLSALRFHGLTTQAPFEVWLAIDGSSRAPKEEMLPLRIVYMSGIALTAGVESHLVEGVTVQVYNIALDGGGLLQVPQ